MILLFFSLLKLTSGRIKRGVAEDYDTSIEEGLGVTDGEDTTFCMKDENCLAIQYCDKTQLKVYGTCEFHSWFWVIIALAVTAVTIVLLTVLLWFWFKKIRKRNTPEESGENRRQECIAMQQPKAAENKIMNRSRAGN